jgi:two-component sensor histidine kinase/PAS domain-containing protein
LGFLHSGETGALLRAHDWSNSPLGEPAVWPQTLRTLLDLILRADQPMSVIWGPERVLFYNDSYAAILMRKHPAAIGQPFPQVWPEIWPDIEPILDRAFDGEAMDVDDLRLVTRRSGQPEEAYFSFSYTPISGEDGSVAGVFCPCRETTHAVRARGRLQADKDRLGELFQQAPGFMCVLRGPEHVFEIINDSYLQLVGHRAGMIGKPVGVALPEIANQGFLELLDGVFSTGEAFTGRDMPVSLQRVAGGVLEQRFVDLLYQPIVGEDGAITGIFVEGSDVSERAAAEAQQTLLLGELNHRVKNLFAVVGGMVTLTARSAANPHEMGLALRGRIDALARAHDLIHPGLIGADEDQGEDTTIEALLRAVLLPYTGDQEQIGATVTLSGPSVPVSGDAVTCLALVFHETSTNAAKYGALSTSEGHLAVTWSMVGSQLCLTWDEQGGPPVTPPTRAGFGSRLVRRSVTDQLHGRIENDWRSHGLTVRITIPLRVLNR